MDFFWTVYKIDKRQQTIQDLPKRGYTMLDVRPQRKKHLIIEGNIGAGKSTFLKIISSYLAIEPVFEPHQKWQKVGGDQNLLDAFYKDIKRWAYTFQSYAFVTRVLELEQAEKNSGASSLVLERSVYSDRYCFAKNCYEMGLMSSLEWELYQEWFAWLVEGYTKKPDGFIYLQTDPGICHQRLKQRKRSEETEVSLDYLTKLHTKHENWLIKKEGISPALCDIPVLRLECDKDFEHDIEEQARHIKAIANYFSLDYKIDNQISQPALSYLVK